MTDMHKQDSRGVIRAIAGSSAVARPIGNLN